jgi:2-polyprenyl-3-methyl-5-hydroxy-6-metoxy-1,4-benzoquinol methylase
MTCYLCSSSDSVSVEGKVRDKPDIAVRKCSACGLIYLSSQKHITDDYYSSIYSKENHAHQDLNDFLRETIDDDERRFQQIRPLINGKRYLDVGCGGGGVLQMARNWCSQGVGVEPQDKWRKALAERGVEVYADLAEVPAAGFDVISIFHVLEHIPDPRAFIRMLLTKACPGGQLIIEVPSADDALLTLYKCKAFSRFTYWSAHLYLYNPHTLAMLLTQAGCTTWLIQQYQRYPLANHLKWLAKGEPGGHASWSFLNSGELASAYASKLAELGLCDTLIAHVTNG